MRPLLTAALLVAGIGVAAAQTPVVTDNGVLNAASYDTNLPTAAGSWAAIFGSSLASGLAQADSIPISTTLGDVQSVTFNGVAAPLLFVSAGQINAQIPWDIPPGPTSVVVTRTSGASQAKTFQVAAIAPGIFTLSGNGLGQAVVVNNADGSLVAPSGSVQGLAAHPAQAGDVLLVYANGLGPVQPKATTGAATGSVLTSTQTMPTVKIGGMDAQVLFSGLGPQFVGVNQVNIVVPNGVTAGDAVPIQITSGGVTTSDRVTIAVK